MASSAITTLAQFYDAMFNTIEPRRRLVDAQLSGSPIDPNDVQVLRNTLDALNAIPAGTGGKYGKKVKLDEANDINFDVEYEVTELEKDLLYLNSGEYALLAHMEQIHPNFREHVSAAVQKLNQVNFGNLISDRDGTINNYCGRYLSSVQSVYNGVFLTKYAQRKVQNALVLTSAPLENKGLVDIACTPRQGAFVYSGSKGREVRTKTYERKVDAIPAEQQQKLDKFNETIANQLKQKGYEKFGLIGSALQFKTGNTTIARQDITKSVPAEESQQFLELIKKILHDIDPDNKTFRVEDTGLDVEVILTVQGEGALKDFDKGNGVEFLDNFVGLNLANVNNLICGDTGSDLPMATASVKHAGKAKTWAVFVTKNEGLRQKVSAVTENNTVFLDTPDELVVTLHELSKI